MVYSSVERGEGSGPAVRVGGWEGGSQKEQRLWIEG